MIKAYQSKNIFCLEGLWDDNLKKISSVEPVLSLLHKQYDKLKYIHRDCATKAEFEFYIKKWSQKRYSDYPILYLAFHGEEGNIGLSDGNIDFESLGNMLKEKCENRIILFASCSTFDVNSTSLQSFIKKTNCLAICGYKADVDWVRATAFELLLLEGMQHNEFSGKGIASIKNKLDKIAKGFKDLKFKFIY